jgi:dTDP-4-dehydrorhamnose 3,5-epimerase
MKVRTSDIPGLVVIEPKVFGDARGFFLETYASERYRDAGVTATFVQDNLSKSRRGVLRGLHLQNPNGQGKLVSVVLGSVWDVALDVRPDSPSFGRWIAEELTAENHKQMYVPPGCAHGFVVTSDEAIFAYKCTELYQPACEMGVLYNDPDLAIPWPGENFTLSAKDQVLPRLRDIPKEKLPRLSPGFGAGV